MFPRCTHILVVLMVVGCNTTDAPPAAHPPYSDDPAHYVVDSGLAYEVQLSEPTWVVPSPGLPPQLEVQAANNNVDILFFEERLFMAWRTAPFHFASEDARMFVVSSSDLGQTWEMEADFALGSDVREPRFISLGGVLRLLFFQGGTNMVAFEPVRMWRSTRRGDGNWDDPEVALDAPEVPWDLKVRDGVAWMTSYEGAHYGEPGQGGILVYFKRSTDGLTWEPVDDAPYVYDGGVSEAAFEFDQEGGLWVVTRNEDGDHTGFGSHLCTAPHHTLSAWDCPAVSAPERYDSPEMFRHGSQIYLIARRDVGGVYGEDDDILAYSLRPKRTALYRVDQESHAIEHLVDLPGVGDTAFPSVRRTGAHSFLVANYTSPLDEPDISWIDAQISERGTQIYLLDLSFVATD